mmetsp:Transcript_6136/g.13439  ORF Transcript_6136/g.13439 Transcript_6136/m.13439 type:complete len:240 (-) Transcript_6136:94-813(-)
MLLLNVEGSISEAGSSLNSSSAAPRASLAVIASAPCGSNGNQWQEQHQQQREQQQQRRWRHRVAVRVAIHPAQRAARGRTRRPLRGGVLPPRLPVHRRHSRVQYQTRRRVELRDAGDRIVRTEEVGGRHLRRRGFHRRRRSRGAAGGANRLDFAHPKCHRTRRAGRASAHRHFFSAAGRPLQRLPSCRARLLADVTATSPRLLRANTPATDLPPRRTRRPRPVPPSRVILAPQLFVRRR